MLYRLNSERAGEAERYAADYQRQHPDKQIEMMDVDSAEGQHMARLYDIVSYPAVLALAQDGAPQQIWQDEQLPLFKELDYYQAS